MSETGRPGFMLYFNCKPMFDYCSDEQAGKLIKACFEYALQGTIQDSIGSDKLLDGYFHVLSNALDEDAKRYAKIKAERSKAGKKGASVRHRKAKKDDWDEPDD